MSQENLAQSHDQLMYSDNYSEHKLAMTVALISWSMLFATLLLGYFVYRFSQTVWPPLGVSSVPLLWPNLSLISVLASSATLIAGHKSLIQKKNKALQWWNISTFVLGIFYMLFQINFWRELNSLNLYSSSNIFGSILHGFTWIHAGHMVCALLALMSVILIFRKEKRVLKWRNYFFNVGMFWHFLTIVWVVLYLTLFII